MSDSTCAGAQPHPFRPGDAVRIIRGKMSNSVGVVEHVIDGERCVVAIGGLEGGVRFILHTAHLELSDSRL
jgi:hypothetical protein